MGSLRKSLGRRRTLVSYLLSGLTAAVTFLALVPLFAIVYMLLAKGLAAWDWSIFVEKPPRMTQAGGGFGPALLGTAVMCGVAALISVPVGVMAAVFTAEVSPDGRLAAAVRFAAKVLTGFPSILAGVFAYVTVVALTDSASALAGGFALSILMLPTVTIAAEQALLAVPKPARDAAFGMGATRTQVILRVALPAAWPGVLTGVVLALARALGETAPLLFAAQFSYYWLYRNGVDLAHRPTSSLSVLIYKFQEESSPAREEIMWAAALVLVLIVLAFNLFARSFVRRH